MSNLFVVLLDSCEWSNLQIFSFSGFFPIFKYVRLNCIILPGFLAEVIYRQIIWGKRENFKLKLASNSLNASI